MWPGPSSNNNNNATYGRKHQRIITIVTETRRYTNWTRWVVLNWTFSNPLIVDRTLANIVYFYTVTFFLKHFNFIEISSRPFRGSSFGKYSFIISSPLCLLTSTRQVFTERQFKLAIGGAWAQVWMMLLTMATSDIVNKVIVSYLYVLHKSANARMFIKNKNCIIFICVVNYKSCNLSVAAAIS